jgi:hypothetical protein
MKTAALLFLSVPLGLLLGCGSDDAGKASPDPNEGRVFTASITAVDGGTVVTEGGTASVKIPAGALTGDTDITIGVETGEEGTWSSVYNLGPDETVFSAPVTISIAYDGTLGEDRKAVLAWKDGATWTPIAGSTTSGGKVSATTKHFSRFSIVILEVDRVDDPMNQGTGDEAAMTYSTWTDPTTQLTWQYPTAVNWMGWQEAVDYCARLNLDGDGWHLPTIGELRSLIRNCPATQTGGTCGVTDGCLEQFQCWGETGICNGCADGGCNWAHDLFYEGEGSCLPPYWSSSTYTNSAWSEPPPPEEDMAWGVMFAGGAITMFDKTPSNPLQEWKVRCVRPAL